MRNNIEAFNSYIEKAKKSYEKLSTVQKWDADSWAAKGDLLATNQNLNLHFAVLRSHKSGTSVITNRNYINWCKAQVANNMAGISFATHIIKVASMKHLYKALLEVKGVGDPWLLDDEVLAQMNSNLVSEAHVELKRQVSNCLDLMRKLYAYGVIPVGITFVNPHKRKQRAEEKELQERRKKADSIDDNERDGEDHLMSMKALNALAFLTWNATNEWERVAIRYYHILIVTGFRVGELLRLRYDALVCVPEINETTCKPILIEKLDENGKPVLDEGGKPELEPQLIWGIEYYPEKGHIAKYKWLDKTSASLVIAAFEFINKQTSACREQLRHLEQHPSKPIRWKSRKITFREINEYFYTVTYKVNRVNIKKFKKTRSENGLFPVDNIIDTARVTSKSKPHNMPMQPVYSVVDLNKYFFKTIGKNHSSTIAFKFGGNGKVKETITVKKSELLCIGPQGVLQSCDNSGKHIHIYPDIIRHHHLMAFFGGPCSNTESASVFNRYGLKEDDGTNIYIMSHMPRHQLNTFLALADINEHQQALIVGRGDIQQNRDYQHLSLKDKTRHQKTSTESMRQRMKHAQQTGEVVAIPEPEDSLLAELVMESTPTKLAVQQSTHAFNKPSEQVEFMQGALEENNLLGELQDTYNEIRKVHGLQAAKEFIEVHGRNFHIVVNGGCTRNLALHGCDKQLRCLDGEGCFHLSITGRPGELDSIQATHQNLLLNVEKMSGLAKAGKLRSRRERDAFEKEKHNLAQMDIVLRKAEEFNGFVPIRVFDTTKRLNQTGPRKTVVESFAQDQRVVKEEMKNG